MHFRKWYKEMMMMTSRGVNTVSIVHMMMMTSSGVNRVSTVHTIVVYSFLGQTSNSLWSLDLDVDNNLLGFRSYGVQSPTPNPLLKGKIVNLNIWRIQV